jgi:hypothetical protein
MADDPVHDVIDESGTIYDNVNVPLSRGEHRFWFYSGVVLGYEQAPDATPAFYDSLSNAH